MAKDKSKQESLERLQNQLEQAKLNNDTDLIKKIKTIIERITNKTPTGIKKF